jgi:hypothetical protein
VTSLKRLVIVEHVSTPSSAPPVELDRITGNIQLGFKKDNLGFGSVRHSRDALNIRDLVWIEVKRCQLVARRKEKPQKEV